MATKKHLLQAAAGAVGGSVGANDPWNISTATFNGSPKNWISIASEESTPNGLFFKPDGTKMYVTGNNGDSVYEYSLSTAWDVSTASYVQNFSVASQETGPQGLSFKPDGTNMYIIGVAGDDVNEYSLSTAWDISTASYVRSRSIGSQDTIPSDIFFKPDGTKLYVAGNSGDDINEYSLSTAWDLTTLSYVQNFSVASQDTSPQGLSFKSDGTKMYVSGTAGDSVYEYSLSTAWDIGTASYTQAFSVAELGLNPQGIFFKPDGTNMYTVDAAQQFVFQYNLSTAWDISTASFVEPASNYFSFASLGSDFRGLRFKPDGTKMYSCNRNESRVDEFSLSSAWNISTASYVQNFSVAAKDSFPHGLYFKPDGTEMYISGDSSDKIYRYSLSTAWDISTSSYTSEFSVSAQELNPQGIFFKPDGTIFYSVGNTGEDLNQYTVSTAWDITTASYEKTFGLSSQDTGVRGIFFKDDGTEMYILGTAVGEAVYKYTLSTAWDLNTASYAQTFSVINELTDPTGIFFTDDGLKMYILFDYAKVFSYDL